MNDRSARDPLFLEVLKGWLRDSADILMLFRHANAGGAKDFELFASFEHLASRLDALPAQTSIIAFRQPQLKLRGVVTESLMEAALAHVPDGSEFLVLETAKVAYGAQSWFHWAAGESHTELRNELSSLYGRHVAVGLYPPWLEDNDNVVSAIVPDKFGNIRCGAY